MGIKKEENPGRNSSIQIYHKIFQKSMEVRHGTKKNV